MGSGTLTASDLYGSSESNVRGWVIAAGIAMLIGGTAAIIYNGVATLASVIVFGWLLAIVGVVQIAHAFQVRAWSGFFLYLLDGILRTTVGVLLMLYPGAGAQALTLVLAFYFVVGGLFKSFGSLTLQFPGWGWSVASGIISVVLGVLLARQWPASGVWFIGFAVGVDLILYGWALLMFVAAVKKLATA